LVVAFENKDLRLACENEDIAIEKYGSTKLQDRLADIFAASTVRDLPVGLPEETEFETLPAYKIDIENGLVMFFLPNHVKTPCLQDGQVDWDKVNRVKIIAIQ
jgi:toxin HigB-1